MTRPHGRPSLVVEFVPSAAVLKAQQELAALEEEARRAEEEVKQAELDRQIEEKKQQIENQKKKRFLQDMVYE